MGVQAKFLGHALQQLQFDLQRVLAGGEAGAVADPEDVRVDGDGRLAEADIHHHVGGLAADTGQGLQLLVGVRHLAAMPLDQQLRQRDHVLGLGTEQADRLDVGDQLALAQRDHLGRCLDDLEQRAGGAVDADVGGLGGQNDGDQQMVEVLVFQLRLRFGNRLLEAGEELGDKSGLHQGHMAS